MTASFSPAVGRISVSAATRSILCWRGYKVTASRDGLTIADARSPCTDLDRPWQRGLKSSDAMTDHGCSIRKPLMGHWRISSAGSLALTSVRNIWRHDESWRVRGARSQVHRSLMLRSCRTRRTGSKRLGKRAKPLRPASLETVRVVGENVCLSGKIGSDRRGGKTTPFTQCEHFG